MVQRRVRYALPDISPKVYNYQENKALVVTQICSKLQVTDYTPEKHCLKPFPIRISDHVFVTLWCSGYHNFIQLSLHSGSVQVQILLLACQRLAMVRISDDGHSWK